MTPDDFTGFASRLVTLGELYDATFSEAKLILYFEALKDLSFEDVGAALVACASTCTFMPKPAEIRQHVLGDSEDQAERAWLKYKELAHSLGGYLSPTFQDSALADALVAVFGSWEAACWSDFTPEMWAAKRKEFGRTYRVLRQRGDDGPRRLSGRFDREVETLEDKLRNQPKALPKSAKQPRQLKAKA